MTKGEEWLRLESLADGTHCRSLTSFRMTKGEEWLRLESLVGGTHCRSLTSFGMTRGEEWLRLESLADGTHCRSLHFVRDDKARGVAQAEVASGWDTLQIPPLRSG